VIVKTTKEDQLIADLTETFTNLREFQWKLNPTKCVFGVPSGFLLGFMVGHRGIEANLVKVDAIHNMAKPSNKKDDMKLTRMMAALGHFISKLGEKGLPFFKLLKKADKFVWDNEAQKAFEALEECLATPPVMTPPLLGETLLLYISATTKISVHDPTTTKMKRIKRHKPSNRAKQSSQSQDSPGQLASSVSTPSGTSSFVPSQCRSAIPLPPSPPWRPCGSPRGWGLIAPSTHRLGGHGP
jgi:hypothetical protein